MSVRSFEDLLEFVNNKFTKISKLTTTADDETTVVVGSDKLLAVGSVSRASACAYCFVPGRGTQYAPSASSVRLLLYCFKVFCSSSKERACNEVFYT